MAEKCIACIANDARMAIDLEHTCDLSAEPPCPFEPGSENYWPTSTDNPTLDEKLEPKPLTKLYGEIAARCFIHAHVEGEAEYAVMMHDVDEAFKGLAASSPASSPVHTLLLNDGVAEHNTMAAAASTPVEQERNWWCKRQPWACRYQNARQCAHDTMLGDECPKVCACPCHPALPVETEPASSPVPPEQDALVDEVQRRMDHVVEAAVEWHQAGREGGEWFEAAERLSAAINSLLDLRSTSPSSATPTPVEQEQN